MRARLNRGAIWLRVLCALALFAVGFAHGAMPAVAGSSSAELAAYALPDGTLPVMCLADSGAGSEKSNVLSGKDCEACRLSASVLLPQPGFFPAYRLKSVNEFGVLPRPDAFVRRLYPPNAAPRAPPLISVTA